MPIDYGHFTARKLLSSKARREKVDWLKEEVAKKCNQLKCTSPPSIIAHSFGSYLVCSVISIYKLKFDKIIFCGAIVPRDYDWTEAFQRNRVQAVLNQFGGMDFWARIVSRFVAGTGPSGYLGFIDEAGGKVIQQGREEFRHSDYFYEDNYKSQWIRFLSGELVASEELRPNRGSSLLAHATTALVTTVLVATALFGFDRLFTKESEKHAIKALSSMWFRGEHSDNARVLYLTSDSIAFVPEYDGDDGSQGTLSVRTIPPEYSVNIDHISYTGYSNKFYGSSSNKNTNFSVELNRSDKANSPHGSDILINCTIYIRNGDSDLFNIFNICFWASSTGAKVSTMPLFPESFGQR